MQENWLLLAERARERALATRRRSKTRKETRKDSPPCPTCTIRLARESNALFEFEVELASALKVLDLDWVYGCSGIVEQRLDSEPHRIVSGATLGKEGVKRVSVCVRVCVWGVGGGGVHLRVRSAHTRGAVR
jgi:hypothetical protein